MPDSTAWTFGIESGRSGELWRSQSPAERVRPMNNMSTFIQRLRGESGAILPTRYIPLPGTLRRITNTKVLALACASYIPNAVVTKGQIDLWSWATRYVLAYVLGPDSATAVAREFFRLDRWTVFPPGSGMLSGASFPAWVYRNAFPGDVNGSSGLPGDPNGRAYFPSLRSFVARPDLVQAQSPLQPTQWTDEVASTTNREFLALFAAKALGWWVS